MGEEYDKFMRDMKTAAGRDKPGLPSDIEQNRDSEGRFKTENNLDQFGARMRKGYEK